MAISFTLNSASSGGRQADITLPATVSAGDLLVAMHYDITNEAIPATPSGWTLINSLTSGASFGTLGIIAKIADGTEDGTNLSWFSGSDNNYAAFSLTPDATITSLGSVTGRDSVSGNAAGGLSLTATPSAGTLPLMLIYAGGSNGAINVTPNGDFSERFSGTDGVELNATFYDTADPTTNLTTNTGDTGRQTLVLGNLNLNFSVSVSANITGVAGTGAVGTFTFSIKGSAAITGVSGASSAGIMSVGIGSSSSISGVSATGSAGVLDVRTGKSAQITGVAGTSAIGSVLVTSSSLVSIPGVQATSAIGQLSTRISGSVSISGVSATATSSPNWVFVAIVVETAASTQILVSASATLLYKWNNVPDYVNSWSDAIEPIDSWTDEPLPSTIWQNANTPSDDWTNATSSTPEWTPQTT